MKKKTSTIILIIVFLAGLGLMLYPTVSNLVNKAHQSVAINSYQKQVAKMSQEEFHNILASARAYNKTITSNEFPRNSDDLEGNAEYLASIDPSGNGMIGYLKIDSINLRMPIYHTTKESILQIGAGHIPTTSLPVGGESTHAVITGHRGLPRAKLFTDLDKVKIGDVFYIYVLDDILAYKVDSIKTVLPENTEDLQIVQGKDYVSLVTCTPYGINTHRLIIRGERIPYDASAAQEYENTQRTENTISPAQIALIAATAAVIIAFIILLIIIIKKKKRKEEEE